MNIHPMHETLIACDFTLTDESDLLYYKEIGETPDGTTLGLCFHPEHFPEDFSVAYLHEIDDPTTWEPVSQEDFTRMADGTRSIVTAGLMDLISTMRSSFFKGE